MPGTSDGRGAGWHRRGTSGPCRSCRIPPSSHLLEEVRNLPVLDTDDPVAIGAHSVVTFLVGNLSALVRGAINLDHNLVLAVQEVDDVAADYLLRLHVAAKVIQDAGHHPLGGGLVVAQIVGVRAL